jgi:hypothetical protein
MSVYIDATGGILHEQARSLALTCPHCQAFAHITPIAVPSFEELNARRPKQVGVVYRCDACSLPVFLLFAVKVYAEDRIELSAQFTEVERPREKFTFSYLPELVETLFREALACYTAGTLNAFASMCRRTAQATFQDLGEAGKLKLFDQLHEIREIADIDAETFSTVKRVIFDTDNDARPTLPLLESYAAGVLVEVMKDVLHQAYVRRGRLQQAMMMRKLFQREEPDNVTAISQAGS